MSSSGQHSEGKSWLQSKNKNIKTCFLEDLEEEMSGKRASFGGKGRLQSEQEVFNGKRNTATSTNEAIISRSHFSSSTPNIYSSSTPSTTKTGSSALIDSAANDVENVGGGVKTSEMSYEKKIRDFQLNSSTQKPNDNSISHSIGALNSLHYASLSRKRRSSSSNSMSSLDAASSTNALLRPSKSFDREERRALSFRGRERKSAPGTNSSFDTGGATKQIIALASPTVTAAIEASSDIAEQRSLANDSFTTAASTLSIGDFCKICHCGAEIHQPLIAPCYCCGSLKFVHQECLQRWIKSSDIKRCELCKYPFDMQAKVKPFLQWEKLDMSSLERRKLFCSVTFHMVAITCVVWSLYVLIDRTAEEIKDGQLAWPFWTKLVVVAIGFTGGLVFMYIQCKVYVHLCRKWKAYNRIIVVQDAPEGIHKAKMAAKAAADAEKEATLASYSLSGSNNNDILSGSIRIEETRRDSNIVGGGALAVALPSGQAEGSEAFSHPGSLSEANKHFNDQESPIDCDEADAAGGPSNRTKTTTTIATVNTNSSESSQLNHKPCKSKTNAETQTALRGVSLMEMIQRSTTTTTEEIENGKCHNGEGASTAGGANKVKVVKVSNILEEAVGGTCHEGNVVQGAAIFFTECECTNNKSSLSSNAHKSPQCNSNSEQHAVEINEENVLTGQLPGSPVDDVNDSMVKTEKGKKPLNIKNTIVSPLPQKRWK